MFNGSFKDIKTSATPDWWTILSTGIFLHVNGLYMEVVMLQVC